MLLVQIRCSPGKCRRSTHTLLHALPPLSRSSIAHHVGPCTEGVVPSYQHAKNCCCYAGGANKPAAPQLHDARALPRMLQLKTDDEPEVCFATMSCFSDCKTQASGNRS